MKKEWYEPEEYGSSSDYEMPDEGVIPTGQEIYAPEVEYDQPLEYFDLKEAGTVEDSLETEKRSHKKRMRKILYGLASMAMVVSLGRTTANTTPVGQMSKQAVWFNAYNTWADYAKGGRIIVGGVDSIAGVGHVEREYRYVDYDGTPVTIEDTGGYGYHGKWINEDGYTLIDAAGNDVYGVYEKDGSLLYQWQDEDLPGTNMIAAAISDNNRVFIQREVRMDGPDIIRNTYYTIQGKELYSAEFDGSLSHNGQACYGTPFRDGVAVCNDRTGILLIRENGKAERLAEWPIVNDERDIENRFGVQRDGTIEGSDGRYVLENVPCVVVDNVSQGYFLVNDTAGNKALVRVDTGEMYKLDSRYGKSDVEECPAGFYVSYTDNEGEMLHYGKLMCAVDKDESGEKKYYLFDATQHSDGNGKRTGYLACHDSIYFEDYQYLAVRDGMDYFYIDLSGNKVSENFKKASTFNEFGYALIQTQDGAFYVIDSAFDKLERLSDIDDFQVKDVGEVFWVIREEGNYSYYYGPK